jgi:hypothetical protein
MKKNYIEAMTNYTEAEKKPITDAEKFIPDKPGRKENRHEHYFTGEDDDKDPNEKNSILPGKAEEEKKTKNEDKDQWNNIQQKKLSKDSNSYAASLANSPDGKMVTSSGKPGLWENIEKKKEREGKNYKPAKPGDADRPNPDAYKKAQK